MQRTLRHCCFRLGAAAALASKRNPVGILAAVDELVVSEGGGTSLRVQEQRWFLVGRRGARPVEEVFYGVLPLLERTPAEGIAAVAALEGPPFPYEQVLLAALNSDSAYWQEQAVPWLDALGLKPAGELAEAARRVTERKSASQKHRQALLGWLRDKPTR